MTKQLQDPRWRGAASRLSAAAAGVSLAALLAAVWTMIPNTAGAVPTLTGAAQIVSTGVDPQPLTAGGTATAFSLRLPTGAACQSDGNNGGRAHTFILPAAQAAADLTFNGTGQIIGFSSGSGGTGTLKNNLRLASGGNQVRNLTLQTGDATILNIPAMSFDGFATGQIPVGDYTMGIGSSISMSRPRPTAVSSPSTASGSPPSPSWPT